MDSQPNTEISEAPAAIGEARDLVPRQRRRRNGPRSKTTSLRDVRVAVRVDGEDTAIEMVRETLELVRPTQRSECAGGIRPCPWVGCRHNLYLNVTESGGLQLTFPDLEPDEVAAMKSCALDIAEAGELTLEEVGETLNLTRERVRQIEVKGLIKVKMGQTLTSDDLED